LVYISVVGACAMALDKVRGMLPRTSPNNKHSVKND
jgi:hypothetical protein